jgi:hypothetical protein
MKRLDESSLRTQGPITTELKSEKGLNSSANPTGRGVWVPAFAGTTRSDARYAKNSICDSSALQGRINERTHHDDGGECDGIGGGGVSGRGGWRQAPALRPAIIQ